MVQNLIGFDDALEGVTHPHYWRLDQDDDGFAEQSVMIDGGLMLARTPVAIPPARRARQSNIAVSSKDGGAVVISISDISERRGTRR